MVRISQSGHFWFIVDSDAIVVRVGTHNYTMKTGSNVFFFMTSYILDANIKI